MNGRPVYHAAASLPSRVREYRSHKARLELNGTPTPWRLEKSLPSAVSGEVAREMKLAGGMINTIEKYTLKSPRDVFLREQFYGNSRCFRVAGPDRRWPAGACSGSIPVQTHHGPRPARRGKEGRPERRRALRHCNSSRGPGSASVASRGQRAPSFSFLLFLSLSLKIPSRSGLAFAPAAAAACGFPTA